MKSAQEYRQTDTCVCAVTGVVVAGICLLATVSNAGGLGGRSGAVAPSVQKVTADIEEDVARVQSALTGPAHEEEASLARDPFFARKDAPPPMTDTPPVQEQVPDEPFVLLKVFPEELPLVYYGALAKADGSFLAQLNVNMTTFFVEAGMEVEGLRVTAVSPESVQLEDPADGGARIVLPYRQKVLTGKRCALVRDMATGNELTVRESNTIGSFVVRSIEENAIVLKDPASEKEVRLEKKTIPVIMFPGSVGSGTE